MIAAGRMTHAVDIERLTHDQDPITGAVTPSWVKVHESVPCAIEPLSVKDMLQSQAIQSEVSVRVVFRYLSGLEDSMRFVGVCGCHSGQVFNPEGYFEDMVSGQEYITAPCSRGINDGDG
jgi:head-tail adaptor